MIGELFVGIVEGVSAIAQLIADSLAFAGGYLGKPPKAGEAHLSVRRVSVALAPLALLVSIIGGICGWCWLSSYARTSTQDTVTVWADRLARDRHGDGHFKRFAGDELPVSDWWGQSLQVEYVNHQVVEVLLVRSLGSDGIAENDDDIVSHRRALLPKKLAGETIKKVGQFALDKLIGNE